MNRVHKALINTSSQCSSAIPRTVVEESSVATEMYCHGKSSWYFPCGVINTLKDVYTEYCRHYRNSVINISPVPQLQSSLWWCRVKSWFDF